jgi:hypothetical protein
MAPLAWALGRRPHLPDNHSAIEDAGIVFLIAWTEKATALFPVTTANVVVLGIPDGPASLSKSKRV